MMAIKFRTTGFGSSFYQADAINRKARTKKDAPQGAFSLFSNLRSAADALKVDFTHAHGEVHARLGVQA